MGSRQDLQCDEGWCYHAHGEVVVEVIGAERCRPSVRVRGMDFHFVLRFVENLDKKRFLRDWSD